MRYCIDCESAPCCCDNLKLSPSSPIAHTPSGTTPPAALGDEGGALRGYPLTLDHRLKKRYRSPRAMRRTELGIWRNYRRAGGEA